MTALTASPALTTTDSESRLRNVLREDALVTAAVGVGVVLAATPLADQLPGSTTVMRVLGIALVLVAADIALASRWSGRRLALAGTVVGELALAWAVLSTVVVAIWRPGAAVSAAVLVVAAVTLAFGVTELKLVRALRR
jgi:predicted acyltransferase